MRTTFAISAGILAAASAARAQTPATLPAPVSGISYRVTFTKESAVLRTVTSEMSFDVSGTDPVLLSLPAWTPGAYEISNFARNVSSFAAAQSGTPIPWEKADPDTWRVHPAHSGRVTVAFNYLADTLDNAASWSAPDFLLFNGTNLFLYPEGASPGFPASVSVVTEPDWKIVTGMEQSGPSTYSAGSYHDLVDMPFFVGVFDLDSAQISGKWVRFASYPARSVAGRSRGEAWSALRKVIPPQVKVFGEAPWLNYSVMQIADSTYPLGSGSGLEHQSSHVDVISPALIGSSVMPSLYAHEIFHSWNVKRLRPADMIPYRYDRPQPTKLLWISEGITDYYADLAEVRGHEVTPGEFYELTRVKMGEVAELPPTSLEDASLSSWIKVRDGTENLYYPKGSLAGMLLDILIRDASNNRASLDNVMSRLYQSAYKTGRGFTGEEWWTEVTRAARGKSFDDFRRRFVEGRDPYPYASVFALAGIEVREDTARAPRIGVGTIQDSAGVRVVEVHPHSSAGEAGVQRGDYLVSVGGVAVDDPEFGVWLRPRYQGVPEGAPINIRVRRGGALLDLPARIQFATSVRVSIAEDPRASPKARAIRAGLLAGTTRP